jgi:predicted MFS family arabinose efflux permease
VSIVVGPTLGGLLVQYGGWRSTIAAVVPVALCAAAIGAFWLPRGTTPRRDARAAMREIDVPGIVTFAGGLTLLLVTLLHPRSFSLYVVAGCVLCFAAWYVIERRSRAPFIDVNMLEQNHALLAVYARYVGIYTIFYSIFYGFPQWLEQVHHATPAQAGLLMLPTSLVAIICAVTGSRMRPKLALLFGCAGALAGCIVLFALHAQSTSYAILAASAVFGIPNGMNPVSEQATLALHARPSQLGVASGLLRTAGYVGAMFASSLIAVSFSGGIAGDRPLHLLATILVAIAIVLVILAAVRMAASAR